MLFLLDAVTKCTHYTHYKIFEVDTGVYYAHTNTNWKADNPPNDFYLSKPKWTWQANVQIPELLLDELAGQLDHYLLSRRQDEQREKRKQNK
jgi:hypothetical protein